VRARLSPSAALRDALRFRPLRVRLMEASAAAPAAGAAGAAALPAIEKYCEGQGEQAASEEAVGVFEKVPAGQGVQPPDRPTARE